MRALVTGATGFIGRHLVQELINRGHSVRGLVREQRRAEILPKETNIHVGNLADPLSLNGIVDNIDFVFHLGAALSGPWELHQEITVEGTRELLQLSCAASVSRFIHVSSVVVYDTNHLQNADFVTEESNMEKPEPAIGPYARGKIEAEQIVHEFEKERELKITIVRPGLVYGPEKTIFEHLGTRVLGRFVAIGDANSWLPFTSVTSVASALIHIAESPKTAGKTYHVVDEVTTPRGDYLRLLGELQKLKYRVIYLPVGLVALICTMLSKLRKLPGLAWLPDTSGKKIRARALSIGFDNKRLQEDTEWSPPESLREELSRILSLNGRDNGGYSI